MVNPLTRMTAHHRAARPESRRRREVEVPVDDQAREVVNATLRGLRAPLLMIVAVFTFCVVGLSLMPGVDADGNPHRLSLFDAFYVMSYTATTIGYGEVPNEFTIPQRMWVAGSIFASVFTWTYAVTAMFYTLTAPGFREATSELRLMRSLRRTRDPFYIVVGHGQAGTGVVEGLVAIERDVVVVDGDAERLERMAMGRRGGRVLALHGDARKVTTLGTAGLGSPWCHGVLAMTEDDETNLAIVMTVNLLRPDVPVIARSTSRVMADRMQDFFPEHVINPLDEFGTYLTMQLRKPSVHRLATWLMSPPGTELEEPRERLDDGPWVVVSDGEFGEEVSRDLTRAGLEVRDARPTGELVDLHDVTGVVVGAESDIVNLSVAARVREANPDCFLVLRQKTLGRRSTVKAFAPDATFHPAELISREALAYLVSPNYWHFVRKVMERDEEWGARVLEDLQARVGTQTPQAARLDVTEENAPALVRWLEGGHITLKQLLTHPESGEPLEVYPAVHGRGRERTAAPAPGTSLHLGDSLLVLGTAEGLGELTSTLYSDADVEKLATGVHVPHTWVFRALRGRRTTPHHTLPKGVRRRRSRLDDRDDIRRLGR
ncbi:potassium channel protein [Kytococcus schroeteri]|uniref:potassium channel protein n=1 Tax=Kytococcus schroeteri TaxID=138300 RepID=UPI001141DA16|nr:potassium channel protein [Kytococcus schroeteri]